MNLYPCPRCARHVLRLELACPFCGEPLDPARAKPLRVPSGHLSRAAQLAFTVTLGAHLPGCATTDAAPRPAPARAPSPPSPRPAPAPDPAPDAAPEPKPKARAMIPIYGDTVVAITDAICFDDHATSIPEAALPTIDAVAEIFQHHDLRIRVWGSAAPDELHAAESLVGNRVTAVVEALVANGVGRDRLVVQDAGSDRERSQKLAGTDRCVRFDVVEFNDPPTER